MVENYFVVGATRKRHVVVAFFKTDYQRLLRLQNIQKPAVTMTMFQGVSTIRELNIVKHITTITLGFAIAFVRDDVEISLVTLKRGLVVKVSREYY